MDKSCHCISPYLSINYFKQVVLLALALKSRFHISFGQIKAVAGNSPEGPGPPTEGVGKLLSWLKN